MKKQDPARHLREAVEELQQFDKMTVKVQLPKILSKAVSVGFTGTQRGMTQAQKDAVEARLLRLYESGYCWFHHGDCIGADAEAHRIACRIGYHVALHPPDIDTKRAFCSWEMGHCYPVAPYLERNRIIVDHCTQMIASPKGFEEEQRSGTWATIRYARKIGTTLAIITPDGRRSVELGTTLAG